MVVVWRAFGRRRTTSFPSFQGHDDQAPPEAVWQEAGSELPPRGLQQHLTSGRSSLQELGFYNPRTKETRLDTEAIRERLGQGAQPTDVVRTLLERGGLLEKTVRPAETVGKAKQAAKREADAKQAAEAKAAAAEEKAAKAEASDSAESESTEG